jgi:hypothetical protein
MHDEPTPLGLCHCGCGRKTNLATRTDSARGYVKGQPVRFISGHGHRARPLESSYRAEDCGHATPCWVWTKATTDGYGRVWHRGRLDLAHRVFYEREHGPIPFDLEIDHLCRNPPCVNPDHLEPVNTPENQRRGDAAKLTLTQVREIRRRCAGGETQRVIAEEFGVDPSPISRIHTRAMWPDPEGD